MREFRATMSPTRVSIGFGKGPAGTRVAWKALRKFLAVGAVAFVVTLVATIPGISPIVMSYAVAHHIKYSGLCDKSFRVSHDSASCLHAWWDNTPPYEFWDFGNQAKWGAQSFCSSYGTVGVHVDVKDGTDLHTYLSTGSKERSDADNKIRDISCCVNKGDLCYKDQVEKHTSGTNAGKIRRVIIESSGYRTAWWTVDNFNQRYQLCMTYPDNVYCKNDPEGDAQTIVLEDTPTSELRQRECGGEGQLECTCGDRLCDHGDCRWHWNKSAASDSCSVTRSGTGVTMPAYHTWECRVVAYCDSKYVTYSSHPAHLRNLVLCDGELKRDSCD